jgi:hypothetical protein
MKFLLVGDGLWKAFSTIGHAPGLEKHFVFRSVAEDSGYVGIMDVLGTCRRRIARALPQARRRPPNRGV